MASAQQCRLFGAAERGECISGDAGRVFGPRVIFSESFFVGRESGLAELECFGRIAAGQEQAPKIVTHAIRVRVLGAEHLLADRQRALVERPRPRKIALRLK
jgi:hypothetical protein